MIYSEISGSKELTGAVDLISHFKLLPHYEFFCTRSLPLSISDSYYLHGTVGDVEVRKGEGMQLDQLLQPVAGSSDTNNTRIRPFDLGDLREAFNFKDSTPIDLPSAEKGMPTFPKKPKRESKEKERKHKKHKDRDKEKNKEHKKHKHHNKDRSESKDKDKRDEKSFGNLDADHLKRPHEKKRKHDGEDDVNDILSHKKSKHRSSKFDEIATIKVAG